MTTIAVRLIGASATGAPVEGLAGFDLDWNRALPRYFRFHEMCSPLIVAPPATERARRILSDVAEADDVARRLQGELNGKLRVAAPMSFGWRHVSPAVVEFLVAHSNLEIDLDLNDRQVDLVSEGYDLAIRIGKLPDSSLIARALAPCRHAVCASPAYLAARGLPRTPSDLALQKHDCLVYSNRPASEQWRFRMDGAWKEAPVMARRLGNRESLTCWPICVPAET